MFRGLFQKTTFVAVTAPKPQQAPSEAPAVATTAAVAPALDLELEPVTARMPSDDEILSSLLDDDLRAPRPAARREEDGSISSGPLTPAQQAADAVRQQEQLIAQLILGAGEALAKSPLYFSAENLAALGGAQCDGAAMVADLDNRARTMLMRSDDAAAHCKRLIAWAAEAFTAYRAAGRAVQLFSLLHEDVVAAPAQPLLRRVTEAAQRVLRHSAGTLEDGDPDRAVMAEEALAELLAAYRKAEAFLRRTPAILPPAQARMTRAALCCLMVLSACAARVAHQFGRMALGLEIAESTPVKEAERRAAAIADAAAGGTELAPLPTIAAAPPRKRPAVATA